MRPPSSTFPSFLQKHKAQPQTNFRCIILSCSKNLGAVKNVKFHKVPELFPNCKVHTEQLWLIEGGPKMAQFFGTP